MNKRLLVCVIFVLIRSVLPGQDYDSDPIEFVGLIHSDQLCYLIDRKYVSPDMVEFKGVVIDNRILDKSEELNDSTILTLVNKGEAFMIYGAGEYILYDIFQMFEDNDSLLSCLKKSHPVKFFEGRNGVYIDFSDDVFFMTSPIEKINQEFSYRNFTTSCFLLVSTTYRKFINKQPNKDYGEGLRAGSWLDPDSQQKVTIIIPLFCEESEE